MVLFWQFSDTNNIDPIVLDQNTLRQERYKRNNTASATPKQVALLQQYYNKYNPALITS